MEINFNKKTIEVSDKLPVENGGRASGLDYKSSIMEIIDNSIDAGNTYINVFIDTKNGETEILNNESGLSENDISRLLSAGKSGNYDSENIGNFGLGAFNALTFLGENGNVTIETNLNNHKFITKLNFDINSEKPMEYLHSDPIYDEKTDYLRIICRTKSLEMFDNVSELCGDLGAHYYDILKSGKYCIYLSINEEIFEVEPIDVFYRDSPKTIIWEKGSMEIIKIQNLDFAVHFNGYYVSGNSGKDERNLLDKRVKRGLPHGYQGIYLNLNGRILQLGNGWGVDGINNKWVGGRLEIRINTQKLNKNEKRTILSFFGITSNKNKPTLKISESSKEKEQIREIIKEFRNWVDREYDKLNDQRKKEKIEKAPKIMNYNFISFEDIQDQQLSKIDVHNLKNNVMLERMFPEVYEAITNWQKFIKSKSAQ